MSWITRLGLYTRQRAREGSDTADKVGHFFCHNSCMLFHAKMSNYTVVDWKSLKKIRDQLGFETMYNIIIIMYTVEPPHCVCEHATAELTVRIS